MRLVNALIVAITLACAADAKDLTKDKEYVNTKDIAIKEAFKDSKTDLSEDKKKFSSKSSRAKAEKSSIVIIDDGNGGSDDVIIIKSDPKHHDPYYPPPYPHHGHHSYFPGVNQYWRRGV